MHPGASLITGWGGCSYIWFVQEKDLNRNYRRAYWISQWRKIISLADLMDKWADNIWLAEEMEEETHQPSPWSWTPPAACSPSPLHALAGWPVRLDGRWRRCGCEAPPDLVVGATAPQLRSIFFRHRSKFLRGCVPVFLFLWFSVNDSMHGVTFLRRCVPVSMILCKWFYARCNWFYDSFTEHEICHQTLPLPRRGWPPRQHDALWGRQKRALGALDRVIYEIF